MPPGMRDRIAREAKLNNRSMNAEIVEKLEALFGASAASRLNWLLRDILPESGHEKLSPELIAEQIGETSNLVTLKVFAGEQEPTFEYLDRVADYLAVNPNWLKRGVDTPFRVTHEYYYGIELADKLFEAKPKKIILVRSMSAAGGLAIVVQQDSFRCEVLSTHIHLSEQIGNSGEGNAAQFSLACQKLWKLRKGTVSSVLMPEKSFYDLIAGRHHALSLTTRANYMHWFDDWWDPAMFLNRNDPNQYWPGYRAFCERIYRVIELDDKLRQQRDALAV